VRLLKVTAFLVTANQQSFAAQFGVKQLTLHSDDVTLAAEVFDIRARSVQTLRHFLMIFDIFI